MFNYMQLQACRYVSYCTTDQTPPLSRSPYIGKMTKTPDLLTLHMLQTRNLTLLGHQTSCVS